MHISSAWARVVTVAASQWGVIHHRQLLRCGLSSTTVRRLVQAGHLHRLYRAVYAVGHPAVPVEGRHVAALFCTGDGATLSHETALWWWGLAENPPPVIHVSVLGRRRHTAGICFHHPRVLNRTRHRRLPVTTVARTFLDVAVSAPVARVRHLLADADFHELVELDDVQAMLRRGCPGSATLRAALLAHMPQLAMTRSELERRFLALCESVGFPIPEVNVLVRGYLVDALWREQRVAVELDGYKGHRSPAQLERDHERDLVLRRAGYEVRRYTWLQVTRRPELVEADLAAAVQGRAA